MICLQYVKDGLQFTARTWEEKDVEYDEGNAGEQLHEQHAEPGQGDGKSQNIYLLIYT